VLVTYASYNPSVGYCQSMNFIVAVFLLVADEEGAFWLLVALCRTVVADYHTRDLSGLRIDTAAFSTLVAQALPDLNAHFVKLEVPLECV
jgi:Rab-GTPase-TBC domain